MATSASFPSAEPRELETLDSESQWGKTVSTLLGPFASLKLTVVLMALAIVIIFIGTLAQTQKDIWEVMREYFRAWIMWVQVDTLFPRSFFPRKAAIPGMFPFPGGALVGSLMALNLLAAHLLRFRVQAKGARFWVGWGVLAVGLAITLAIILGGHLKQTQQDVPWLAWSTVWRIMVTIVLAGGLGCLGVALFRTTLDGVSRSLYGVGGAICLGAFLWVLVNDLSGTPIRPSDSSLRILWQMMQASIGGLALLVGCELIFKQRAGIVLLHGGVGLLMVGEALVAYNAVESQLRLVEGATSNYTYDIRTTELALVDSSDEDEDHVLVVPQRLLTASVQNKSAVVDAAGQLPVEATVVKFFRNHDLVTPTQAKTRIEEENKRRKEKKEEPLAFDNPATAGLGLERVAIELPQSKGTDSSAGVDLAAAYVRFTEKGSGKDLGTYLLSQIASEGSSQPFEKLEVDGKTYEAALRFKRIYHPFTVTLKDVRQDNYVGTNTPRNYSSDIRLVDHTAGIDMTPHIMMNNPLRYGGNTFYQSGYMRDPDSGQEYTTLAVVTNTGWMIPYVSCMLVSIGMLAHFTGTLYRFLLRIVGGSAVSPVRAELARGEEIAIRPSGKPAKALASGTPLGTRLWKNFYDPGSAVLALAACGLFALMLYPLLKSPKAKSGEMDLVAFGKLPVADKGRVKPLDTLARTSLRVVSNQETFKDENGKTQPAIRWLADLITGSAAARDAQVIRIENLEVLSLLGLEPRVGKFRYSIAELETSFKKFEEQVQAAHEQKPEDLEIYQRKLIELENRLKVIMQLMEAFRLPQLPRLPSPEQFKSDREGAMKQIDQFQLGVMQVRERLESIKPPLVIPADPAEAKAGAKEWQPYPLAWTMAYVQMNIMGKDPDEATLAFNSILEAYTKEDAAAFNREVAKFSRIVSDRAPQEYNPEKVAKEQRFNTMSPFFYGYWFYVAAFVFTGMGALAWFFNRQISFATWVFLLLVFCLHSYALWERMIISGRPPVTNLYSSAVFIGWACVGFGLLVELVFRLAIGNGLGLGNGVAAVSGAITLYIAHLLSNDGDTLTVLQAVLDTNFWLMTHVTCVTLGYAATFLAGALAVVYILLGICTPTLQLNVGKLFSADAQNKFAASMTLERILYLATYGVLCFAILFSFVGTVLGGLWADDSWGRFWGWDPKENGALIIVLWNALVLHARWGGMVKERGLAVLAVGGNIVTAWSWFGVNELGVGLHSYGFTEGVLRSLGLFVLSQLIVIGAGSLPKSLWWSFRASPRASAA